MKKFTWIKVLFSPFKPFKIRVYIGKTTIGVPYFLPRKWVKYTEKDIEEKINEVMNNPKFIQKPYDYWYDSYKNYSKAVSLKVGFSYCDLGWKTKWSDTDYRYEWNPVLSFVFFGYQIALRVYTEYPDHYWTSWLYYERNTNKTKSKKERIQQCIKEFPQIWQTSKHVDNQIVRETTDYYKLILRKKYL